MSRAAIVRTPVPWGPTPPLRTPVRQPAAYAYRVADALAGLRSLPAGAAGLVLTDLPSGMTQAPFDVAPDLPALFAALRRVVTPAGVIVLLASHFRFAQAVAEAAGPLFRYELIWHKGRATGFLNAKIRPLNAHEYVLVCARPRHQYTPQKTTGHRPMNSATRKALGANYGAQRGDYVPTPMGGDTERLATTVLAFRTVASNGRIKFHPQQKPVPLCRWFVRTYSQPGELVVDPYAGSAAVGVAALLEGRRFIGFDTDAGFAAKGAARLADFRSEAADP